MICAASHQAPDASVIRVRKRRVQKEDPLTEKPIRFYDDNGREINPDLIAKPSLCISCAKDDDPMEEPLCALNRLDQKDEEEFLCDAYTPKEA